MKPIDILGGESVYCINEDQWKKSFELAERDPESSPRIQAALRDLETTLNRNERAALAFVLIDRLLKSTFPG
jgi:PHD/YefM family antitoxin component YafN of YafNO toxin-antitoxin module